MSEHYPRRHRVQDCPAQADSLILRIRHPQVLGQLPIGTLGNDSISANSQHLWGRRYWVATSGNVTDEVWKKYIEDQKPEDPDDHFKVV
jgi:REP element-mobilizing transposase RayT